jgi:nitrate reductase cytochrome c-type subunit
MAHSFTVEVSDEISTILKRVEEQVVRHGGRLEGNAKRGSFEGESFLGLIKGEYHCISDTEIKINITDKPFMVPHSLIEYEIKKHLG